jgi:hypothetical protein
VLLLLTAVYALNVADRFVMSTLIEPIKADLHLSDSAVGFLTGVTTAIFYVTAGLALSVLAERWIPQRSMGLAERILRAWFARRNVGRGGLRDHQGTASRPAGRRAERAQCNRLRDHAEVRLATAGITACACRRDPFQRYHTYGNV